MQLLPLPFAVTTSLLRLLFPSLPGPPGFLLPNRTTLHYWDSESGMPETGLENTDWIQNLSRNRDEDDCVKTLLHSRKRYLLYC